MSVRPCPTCHAASPIWLEACHQDSLTDFYRCERCQTVWHIPKLHPTAVPSIIRLQRNGVITLPVDCWSCGQPVLLEVGDVALEDAATRAAGHTDRDRKRWPCPWCEFRNLGGVASRVISASRRVTVLR